jgi:hypothetical protein
MTRYIFIKKYHFKNLKKFKRYYFTLKYHFARFEEAINDNENSLKTKTL